MAKIGVFGACGFIGSHFVNTTDADFVCVDDLSLGKKENLKKKVPFIQGDIAERQTVEEALKNVDAVVMMNGLSSNPMYYPDPRRGYETMLMGALNVFETCRRRDITRVVYASTSSLYGHTGRLDQEEEVNVKPPNFYSAAKFAVEQAASLYAETYGMTTIGLRNFSVYGYPEKHKGEYANIITQFIWKMMEGKQPVIYGDGSQTRDFVFVSDIAEAIRKAIDANLTGSHIFNLGTGKDASFNDVVMIINEKLGTSIEPIYTANQIHNYIFTTLAQVTRAQLMLGWEAKVGLDEGIQKTIDFYKKWRA